LQTGYFSHVHQRRDRVPSSDASCCELYAPHDFRGARIAACLLLASLAPCCADPAPIIHYAPAEHLEHVDVALIDRAEREIDMAAYVLTDWAVMQALTRAADRGVHIRIYLDGTQLAESASLRRSSGTLPRRLASRLGSNTRPATRCTSRATKSTGSCCAPVPRIFPHCVGEKQALGRSRGGFSTKIHLRTNAKGNPLSHSGYGRSAEKKCSPRAFLSLTDAVDKADKERGEAHFWCFEGRFCPWLLTAAPRRGSCETLEASWTLMLTRHTQPPCRAVDARRGLRAS
jgi:hypothetical protein